jgi:hypothetical protein
VPLAWWVRSLCPLRHLRPAVSLVGNKKPPSAGLLYEGCALVLGGFNAEELDRHQRAD